MNPEVRPQSGGGKKHRNAETIGTQSVANTLRTAAEFVKSTVRSAFPMPKVHRDIPHRPFGEVFSKIARKAAAFAAGFAFSLGRIGDSAYPFGTAFLASSRTDVAFTFAGTLAASLLYPQYKISYLGLNIAAFAVRLIYSSAKFDESRATRMIIALSSAGFMSLLRLAFGFTAENAVMSVLHVGLTALAAYMFTSNEKDDPEPLSTAAKFFPWAVLCFSLRDLSYYGSSPAAVCASLLTMCFSRMYGSAVGACAGVVFGTTAFSAPFLPAVLGICGIAEGALEKKRVWTVPCTHAAVSTALVLLLGDDAAYFRCAADAVIASVLFVSFMAHIKSRTLGRVNERDGRNAVISASDVGFADTVKEFDGLSEAFSSLSQIFYRMSERMKTPPLAEVKETVEKVCSGFCLRCRAAKDCKCRREVASSDVMIKALCGGKLTKKDLPDSFAEGCVSFEKLLYCVNSAYRELFTDYFKSNKTEVLAAEYSSVARLIKYTTKDCAERGEPSVKTAAQVTAALAAIRIFPERVTATSGRDTVIDCEGVRIETVSYSAAELAVKMSAATGILLSPPEFVPYGTKTHMIFRRKRRIFVEYAKACHAKDGESVSGDSVSFFESDRDRFYALISDGMGSGREAALTSRLTAVFIEKLLSTGAHKGATLELLNNLLLSNSSECFATVDLLEIDLLDSKASFIKAGAAPAYVVRSAKLYKISSETPPAGIIGAFSAENTSFSLHSGDVILLLSDGITENFDNTPWLAEILGFNVNEDISKLASAILAKARSLGIHDDDMSVVAVRVR